MDNSYSVSKIIKMLKEETKKFLKLLKPLDVKGLDVKTFQIMNSSRYKYMRVFYVKDIKYPPKDAFKLGKQWTMDKWLKG